MVGGILKIILLMSEITVPTRNNLIGTVGRKHTRCLCLRTELRFHSENRITVKVKEPYVEVKPYTSKSHTFNKADVVPIII
jgi:hypothetical protein